MSVLKSHPYLLLLNSPKTQQHLSPHWVKFESFSRDLNEAITKYYQQAFINNQGIKLYNYL